MAELVDAHDSKSCSARSGGSIPSTGTNRLYHCIAYHRIEYVKYRFSRHNSIERYAYYNVYLSCISAQLGVFLGVS